jgi:hypothetical protein
MMEDIAKMMIQSGYPERYRDRILQAAITGYQTQPYDPCK